MAEIIALAVLVALYLLPWSNPFLVGAYLLAGFAAMVYLSMAVVDRFIKKGRILHRIGEPPDILDQYAPEDAAAEEENTDDLK